MRYANLTEKASDDLDVLSDIADVIISLLPETIKVDDVIKIRKLPLDGKFINRIHEKYGKRYDNLLMRLSKRTTFIFDNHSDSLGGNDAGLQMTPTNSSTGDVIVVVLPVLLGGLETRTKSELLSTKVQNSGFKSVKAVLIHEMRHTQQKTQYGGVKNSDRYSYPTNPDEIDAAWIHHLQDYDIDDYENAQDFTKDVMKSFSLYKKLNNKQKDHYLRKTMRFWVDRSTNSPDENKKQSSDISSRLKQYKEVLLSSTLKAIHKRVEENDYRDLRKFDGYDKDSDNFLLPVDRFVAFLNSVVRDEISNTSPNNIAFMYGFVSLLAMNNKDFPISLIEKRLTKLGMTPIDAYNYLLDNELGGFDTMFFSSIIKQTFNLDT